MSKQITLSMYAYWTPSSHRIENLCEPGFGLTEHDMRQWAPESRGGRVIVKEVEVTFEVPADFDPLPERIADLEAQKTKARAEFQARVTELDRQIQSLLAIEHQEASHG